MRRRLATLLIIFLTQGATAQTGFQSKDVDRTVDPCTDFDEFANGAWRDAHPMPPTETTWSRKIVTAEATRSQLNQILEEAVRDSSARGANRRLIGDFYSSCMDERMIETKDLDALRPLVREIGTISDRASLTTAIIFLQQIAVAAPLGLVAIQDPENPDQMIANVVTGGLGLPGRDYYLGESDAHRDVRDKYVAHVRTMFKLAGWSSAQAAVSASSVLRLEKQLSEMELSREALRNPKNLEHRMSLQELQASIPSFNWAQEAREMGLHSSVLNVQQPKLLAAFADMLTNAPLDDWKAYLVWHLLHSQAAALPSRFEEEDFDFYSRFLRGVDQMSPRWERCVESTDRELGDALAQGYVERYFPAEAKERVRQMALHIVTQLKLSIASRDWMTANTKLAALTKLALLKIEVGYPNKWKDYRGIKLDRTDYLGNRLQTARFSVTDDLSQVGHLTDRDRWYMTPSTPNSYYNPQANEVVFPAAYLQPPGFDLHGTDAANYGAIGVTLGHEISQLVDDEGAHYDGHGRLTNWWSPLDYAAFETKAACLVQQYENYFIEPGIHLDGKLVLGDALGDLGGATLAYRAYKAERAGKTPERTIDGFTPDQQFFIAEAQWRGALVRRETMRLSAQTDTHATPKWRVIGPLSNMPEFARAFGCRVGSVMVRPAFMRCTVW